MNRDELAKDRAVIEAELETERLMSQAYSERMFQVEAEVVKLRGDLDEAVKLLNEFDTYSSVPDDIGYVGSSLAARTGAFLSRLGESQQ